MSRARRWVALALVGGLAALAFAVAAPAQNAQSATSGTCRLAGSDQDPPGGTPAYALTLRRTGTSCKVARAVMRSFHRCRGEGGSRCGRRVLTSWTCSASRKAAGPDLGDPVVSTGRFTCRSGARRVAGGYQENGPKCFGAAARDPKRPCSNRARTMSPALDQAETHGLDLGAAGCEEIDAACDFGVSEKDAKRRFAVLGDSHVLHWRAALAAVAQVKQWRGYSIAAGGCFFSAAAGAFTEGCTQIYNDMLSWVNTHPKVDTVFVTSNADTPVVAPAGQTPRDVKIDGFRRAFQGLPKTVKHVIVLRDTPASSEATFACLTKAVPAGQPPGSTCPLARSSAIREDVGVVTVKQLNAKRYQSIDMTRYFCDTRFCFPAIGGSRVNLDIFGHLTVTYLRTLGPYLLREIDKLEAGW